MYKMMSDEFTYKIGVLKSTAPFLVSEIYIDGVLTTEIVLTSLTYDEMSLDSGRFRNFSFEKQEHTVQMTRDPIPTHELINYTAEYLDFIDKQISCQWSLTVWEARLRNKAIIYKDVLVIFDFSFADENEATFMKLSF